MVRVGRALLVILVLLSAVAVPGAGAMPRHGVGTGLQVLARDVAGVPVVAGQYIFWTDKRGEPVLGPLTTIQGFDLARGTEFVVAGAGDRRGLASDDQTVAWVERTARGERIVGHDLRAGAEFTIVDAAGPNLIGDLAIDRGILYYVDGDPDHRGIFARTLATGQERRVSAEPGQRLRAGGGALVWSDVRYSGEGVPPEARLFLGTPDGARPPLLLAEGRAEFGGYAVSGGHVVWSFSPGAGDPRVQLYAIGSGARATISDGAGFAPVVNGDDVAWAEVTSGGAAGPARWSLRHYRIGAGTRSTIIEGSVAPLAPAGIATGGTLAFTTDEPARGLRTLFAGDLGPQQLPPFPTSAPRAAVAGAQVYASGAHLYVGNERWTVDGVQFILPQAAINNSSFYDDVYGRAAADGSLDFWLDKAQNGILAKNLRIFVELPSVQNTARTSHETLYDFAQRAAARGMRLGIVLHNNADFAMTEGRRAWIGGLLDLFAARGATHLIAYVSADNEINNHCAGANCYDNPDYLAEANGWVANFKAIFAARNSPVLVTAGISSEVATGNIANAIGGFFATDRNGRQLAYLVDFISPHNFGGGGYAVIDEVRHRGYTGPVVLEEYGFPTDPMNQNAIFTEGPPLCRTDPLDASCANTAPRFVEINNKALRETTYAGGQGECVLGPGREVARKQARPC